MFLGCNSCPSDAVLWIERCICLVVLFLCLLGIQERGFSKGGQAWVMVVVVVVSWSLIFHMIVVGVDVSILVKIVEIEYMFNWLVT